MLPPSSKELKWSSPAMSAASRMYAPGRRCRARMLNSGRLLRRRLRKKRDRNERGKGKSAVVLLQSVERSAMGGVAGERSFICPLMEPVARALGDSFRLRQPPEWLDVSRRFTDLLACFRNVLGSDRELDLFSGQEARRCR